MKKETITAAPQAYVDDDLYEAWMETHTGTKEDFLEYMMIPSVDRTEFLSALSPQVLFNEGVVTATYSV